jgi:SAM-dependent methyltransferase
MTETRLNVGAGPSWRRAGWATSDHKKGFFKGGSAWSLDFPDGQFDLLFSSHMLEHIPHFKIDSVLHEFNRVLKPGAEIRLLCPDLEVIARAYVEKDEVLRAALLAEDPAIRTDIGFGGSLVNFVVSGGSDMLMFSRSGDCIGGYGHIYAYDFEMLKTLLERHGFGNIRKCGFLESNHSEFREPLHPVSAPARWVNEPQWGDRSSGMTGFDRDPVSSLIVEAAKVTNSDYAARNFGVRRYRGLNPAPFSWKNITIAYFGFTLEKAKQLPSLIGRSLTSASRRLLPPQSKGRQAVKKLVPVSLRRWISRD